MRIPVQHTTSQTQQAQFGGLHQLVAHVVPGVQTIENLARAGGTGLLVTAGRVILIDKPEVLAAADRLGITIVGRAAE